MPSWGGRVQGHRRVRRQRRSLLGVALGAEGAPAARGCDAAALSPTLQRCGADEKDQGWQ